MKSCGKCCSLFDIHLIMGHDVDEAEYSPDEIVAEDYTQQVDRLYEPNKHDHAHDNHQPILNQN
jgi:hypothetical protein